MTDRAKQLREVARQALYSTPMTEECEVPIMVATLRETINQLQKGTTVGAVIMCADVLELCEELEAL